MKLLAKYGLRSLAALLAIMLPQFALADAHADAPEGGGRAMAMVIEAVITDIDLETKQVTIEGPLGQSQTLTATEEVVSLEDVSVGDRIRATYLSALEGEVREPTEEEKENPWVVLEEAGQAEGMPAVGAARMIRAVCTIEGMNRILGTVTVMDPRGKLHLIEDVEPEKMEGVTLGQSIVMVYSEALALSLEPLETAAAE
ncbi:MAG: hypothetical protein AAGI11_19140 [Pseudomonadota bacterium]